MKFSDVRPEVVADLKQRLPSLKSQAQFNVFLTALDSLCVAFEGIFGGDTAKADQGWSAVRTTFDLASRVTEATNRLQDVPDAASSKEADAFKQPPAQFGEYDAVKGLLSELEDCTSLEALNRWYADTKERRERIVSQGLRDSLVDAVRQRKIGLTNDTLKEGEEPL